MINYNGTKCSTCDGFLKYYDKVRRNVRTRYGSKYTIKIRRYRCMDCTKLHREMPPEILPYKHYERCIIEGVVNKYISSETIGFEDYPCERTMTRWIHERK